MRAKGQYGFVLIFILSFACVCFAQEPAAVPPAAPSQPAARDAALGGIENVTLDFKDADIRNVLKILAQKSGVNIVATPDVVGTVTIKLVEVPWDRAMDVILKSNGFGYQRQGNVILVTKMENMSKIQSEEPLRTEIIDLKFLDAQDAMRILIPILSTRGKISILYTKGQKGWKFGSFKIGVTEVASGALQREAGDADRSQIVSVEKNPAGQIISTKMEVEPAVKSKTIMITDTDAIVDRIKSTILPQIDRKPKQVLVEARIMEVNRDKLKDIGFDYGSGATGAEGGAMQFNNRGNNYKSGSRILSSEVTPASFGPKVGDAMFSTEPYNTGLELILQKVTGKQYEIIIHALEEKVHANMLSAPRIVTLDNQEASILVGYHTPILKSDIAADTTSGTSKLTQTLDYYQEIGIRLNVVPQVSEEGYINMIIHPSITSSSTSVAAQSVTGNITTTTRYPIIDVREAQTQIFMKDGETIVIGGLLKDVESKSVYGVPFLSQIPLLGMFFRRETVDTSKIDLLIFITAHVIKEDEFSPEEIARLQERMKTIIEKPKEDPKKQKQKAK